MISLPSVWFPGLLEKEENFEISLSRLAHTACYTMWIPHSLIFFFSKRNQHSRWAFSATNRQQKGKLNRVFRNSKSKSGGVQVRETIKEENSNKIWIKQNLLKDFRNDGNEKNYEITQNIQEVQNRITCFSFHSIQDWVYRSSMGQMSFLSISTQISFSISLSL